MDKATSRQLATSLTALVFVVIAITGVLLYFKLLEQYVKELHEIIGLLFVAAAAVHVYFNWKSMKNYFSKKVFIYSSVIVVMISLGFIGAALNEGGENPKLVVINSMFKAPLEATTQVLSTNKTDAIAKLQKSGIVVGENNSIEEIAQANKTSPWRIVTLITAK